MDLRKYRLLLQEYSDKYHTEGLELGVPEFEKLVLGGIQKARVSYKKLKEPRILPFEVYTRLWIRELLDRDFSRKSLRSFKPLKPPVDLRNTGLFVQLMHPLLVRKLYKKIYDAPPKARENMWKSINLSVDEIEKRFVNMVRERNRTNKYKGFISTVDFYLKMYKIPKSDYWNFLKNVNKVIEYCNSQLPNDRNLPEWFYSEFNNYPCFVCRLSSFPFKNLDDVFKKMNQKYKSLSEFKKKIKIRERDVASSYVIYKKESDEFEIVIKKS